MTIDGPIRTRKQQRSDTGVTELILIINKLIYYLSNNSSWLQFEIFVNENRGGNFDTK